MKYWIKTCAGNWRKQTAIKKWGRVTHSDWTYILTIERGTKSKKNTIAAYWKEIKVQEFVYVFFYFHCIYGSCSFVLKIHGQMSNKKAMHTYFKVYLQNTLPCTTHPHITLIGGIESWYLKHKSATVACTAFFS